MAVSGNQLTRLGAWLSGIGKKITITAKSPGIPAIVTGTPTSITGFVIAPSITGTIEATSITGFVSAPSITGRVL